MSVNVGGIFVTYNDGGGTTHELVKYVASVGDAASFLASPGSTIDLATITTGITCVNAGTLIAAFLKSLEFVAPTGSGITGCHADFRVDNGPGTVDASTSYLISNFTPAGGTANNGPKPIGFAATSGVSATTNRRTWLRLYSSGRVLWDQSTLFASSDIDADFATYLSKFANPGGNLTQFAHWSGSPSAGGQWLGSTPFNTALFELGCRNG